MSTNKNKTIENDGYAESLDFGRAIENLVIPPLGLIELCVESNTILQDLLHKTSDEEEKERIKLINTTISMCADFFGDSISEEYAKKTARKKKKILAEFRKHLKEELNGK